MNNRVLLPLLLAAIVGLPCNSAEQVLQGEVEKGHKGRNEPTPNIQEAPDVKAETPVKPLRKTWVRIRGDRNDFLVFARNGAGYTGPLGTADDVQVIGALGAIVCTNNKRPALDNGAVLITCRRGFMKISTKHATVSIPQGATVLLNRVPSEYNMQVAMVSGSAAQEVVASPRAGHQNFSLHPGQMVTLFENPRDTAVEKIDRAAFRPEVAALLNSPHASAAPLRVLGDEGTEFLCSGPDTINVRVGEIFMQVPDHVVVRSSVGDVLGGKGAIIDVDADAETLRLKSLSGPGHAIFSVGERTINVSPGQELLVASHEIHDDDLYPADGIGRRKNETLKVNDKLFGASCDFSMISYLTEATYVQGLKKSGNPDDKNTIDKILKTAAAVQTITPMRGMYRATPRTLRKRSNPTSPRGAGGSA